ncbi:hypothetical protein Tco_0978122 [Tanacetum coccineum]|uniref:Uncharacterized protein n=1 Tax=Tanacetum coccineum TaxID=301880 RepID=A0ABQ5EM49_9ASTR
MISAAGVCHVLGYSDSQLDEKQLGVSWHTHKVTKFAPSENREQHVTLMSNVRDTKSGECFVLKIPDSRNESSSAESDTKGSVRAVAEVPALSQAQGLCSARVVGTVHSPSDSKMRALYGIAVLAKEKVTSSNVHAVVM